MGGLCRVLHSSMNAVGLSAKTSICEGREGGERRDHVWAMAGYGKESTTATVIEFRPGAGGSPTDNGT